jgi:prolyl-tRNA synthetase
MIMVHGDDRGLVLPPKVAPIQVVIVPIHTKQGFSEEITKYSLEIKEKLESMSAKVSCILSFLTL